MKICLAGTFGEEKSIDVLKQSPYLLESYYYVKPWQYELIDNAKMFMLDSGAFTFFSSGKTLDWNEYLERYANFIKEHNIKHFFELDIDDLIGYGNVCELRKKLEGLTKRKSIPVWHMSRGLQTFKQMCDEYDYVAIGGLVGKDAKSPKQIALEKYFPQFVHYAHSRGAKIHCLGYTKVKELPRLHFDSVDSTRWNCARFGRIEYFDGQTMRSVDKRHGGKKVRSEAGVAFTLKEWVKYQKYADAHF